MKTNMRLIYLVLLVMLMVSCGKKTTSHEKKQAQKGKGNSVVKTEKKEPGGGIKDELKEKAQQGNPAEKQSKPNVGKSNTSASKSNKRQESQAGVPEKRSSGQLKTGNANVSLKQYPKLPKNEKDIYDQTVQGMKELINAKSVAFSTSGKVSLIKDDKYNVIGECAVSTDTSVTKYTFSAVVVSHDSLFFIQDVEYKN